MQKACCNIASLVDFCILQDNVQFSILNSQFSIFIDIAKLQHRFARFGGCFTILGGSE